MKESLTRNLSLKILSVVLAFIVWLVVVNVSDPEITGSKEVTLEVHNEAVMTGSGMTYEIEGKKTTVTVTYKVRTQDRSSITSADFRAYIDLADYYPVTGTVPVYVEVLNNKEQLIDNAASRPEVVRIKTEQIQQKEFTLNANLSGTPEDGYEVYKTLLDPKTVTLNGPESVIGRINSVGVEIDTEGVNSDLTGTADLVYYDSNGNELAKDERVTADTPSADFTVLVMKGKKLSLKFDVGGQVADGYRYIGMETSAESVSVLGMKSAVESLDTLEIPASVLNMEGATSDVVINVNLSDYLPDGSNMSIPGNSVVTVTLKIRKLERVTLTVPTNRIIKAGASDRFHYEYDKDNMEVTIEGLEEDLSTVTASDIVIESNVADLGLGTHKAALTFDGLRDDFEVVANSEVQLTITAREAGPGFTEPASSTAVHVETTTHEESTEETATEGAESSSEETTQVEEKTLPAP